MQDVNLIWIVVGLVAIIMLWIVVTYNGLIRHANFCNDAWADIDTELKRRYDLIPNWSKPSRPTPRTSARCWRA